MEFHVFTSNRLESLVKQLAEIIKTPLASPATPEIVVVQSRGMERWVSLQLADRNKICANIRFPFPNALLQDIFQTLVPVRLDGNPFDPDCLMFRIMKQLVLLRGDPNFESLDRYVADDPSGLKQFQLAGKIADRFDQYLVFRPEMIFSWEAGKSNHWQARLWRQLTDGGNHFHRARLRNQLLESLQHSSTAIPKLPERISIFGISHLPNFHIQVFAEVARHIPVYLFLMNPCREFWGDIVSRRDQKQIREKYKDAGISEIELHMETGNRLLASLGTLGRDFFNSINEYPCEFHEGYGEPKGDSLLARVQSDILNLREGSQGHHDAKADSSIQVHACHSPMREMETLYDAILSMFEELPGLLPKDIIVMTPDIETYVPFIQAVFGSQTDSRLRIPFGIADRSIRTESRVIEAFLTLLDLKGTRMGASQILSLLEYRSIRNKFNISESDLPTIGRWVRESGIRWGIDAESRKKLDLPKLGENTWKAGIERMLLGYAMRADKDAMYDSILPYDRIEGNEAVLLGRFIEFAERIFSWVKHSETARPLSDWSRVLQTTFDFLFHVEEEMEHDVQLLRTHIDQLERNETLSGFTRPLSLEVVRSYLHAHTDQAGGGSGFISGGVTFCAMLPMRSIPFDVVCLTGMNSDAFPRQSPVVGFDFVVRYPKPGDRSRRNDDRYLFLESLLSARKKLYISYVGQSIQDDSEIPPSVLVSELMDYVSNCFGTEREDLLTRHRLQAFSPDYFRKDNEKLTSYSEENKLACTHLLSPKSISRFISSGLSAPEELWREISVDQLKQFFTHPTRFLLQNRLGIHYESNPPAVEDREYFKLDPLRRYLLGREMVEHALAGEDPEARFAAYRTSGQLPHGAVGEAEYRSLRMDTDDFVRKLKSVKGADGGDNVEVDQTVDVYRIFGELENYDEDRGLIRYRFSQIKPKDLLSAWIEHLLLCQEIGSGDRRTVLLSTDTAFEFNPVEDAESILGILLSRYWEGLIKPLPFFPETSYDYAKRIFQQQKPEIDALKGASAKWHGNDFSRGESEDPYFRRCFATIDPLCDEFKILSLEIYQPLMAHISRYALPS